MGVIINEFIVYILSYNFATHLTCLLTLTVYKYNELQVFGATQKLGCKANCKTPLFFTVYMKLLYEASNFYQGKTPSQNGILVKNKVFDKKD
jgi:hypothetical protein